VAAPGQTLNSKTYRSDPIALDYTYDHIGQLRTAVGTGGQSTENLDAQERTSANTPTVSYARGQDLSGTLEGVGGIGGLLARSDQYSGGTWGRHVCYHADGNGNVTALIGSAQTVVARGRRSSPATGAPAAPRPA
jgi:hypothetical protein